MDRRSDNNNNREKPRMFENEKMIPISLIALTIPVLVLMMYFI